MNELEKFIVDFQKKAMIHGSTHYVTGEHMPRGWHSDTIIQACVEKFGGSVDEDLQLIKDAKAFMVKQIESK